MWWLPTNEVYSPHSPEPRDLKSVSNLSQNQGDNMVMLTPEALGEGLFSPLPDKVAAGIPGTPTSASMVTEPSLWSDLPLPLIWTLGTACGPAQIIQDSPHLKIP